LWFKFLKFAPINVFTKQHNAFIFTYIVTIIIAIESKSYKP